MASPATITVVQNHPLCALDLLAPALAEFDVITVAAHEGVALPADLGGGLVVLGGYQNAYDDVDALWLPALREVLRGAVEEAVPTLGICLGAQLLAVACGGVVQVKHPEGIEAGVIDVTWAAEAAEDPLFGGVRGAAFAGPSMHADAVVELPPGAVLLGSSTRYENQVFRVGAAAWGVQFHPEASLATFARWARDAHAPGAVDAYAARSGELAANARSVGERFASLVRG